MFRRMYMAALVSQAVALVAVASAGAAIAASPPTVHKIGAVTWHAAKFVNQDLVLSGYLLLRADGYVLFSDEPGGRVSQHDLPVTGAGIELVQPKIRYAIRGHFVHGGLVASNGNPYHLELSAVPEQEN